MICAQGEHGVARIGRLHRRLSPRRGQFATEELSDAGSLILSHLNLYASRPEGNPRWGLPLVRMLHECGILLPGVLLLETTTGNQA
jgi:hypothetical protein